ncbi:hypothetical protein ElyMa_001950100 [Elysia marginata]|uniref:G-protein coupled receptors family 1 profile domain-containing protein n=1 Tax=Elysia marginata TaxID=1093978 RepID=A0AAV4EWY7_9GAST|nr:hypothetical protein ElyMa_001950100 [Elysia marginata]
MQSAVNQSLYPASLLATFPMTSQLTTPLWPVAKNASVEMYTFTTTATSYLTTGESTLVGDQEGTVSLAIIPSPSSGRQKREETGYDVVSDLLEKYYSLFLLLFGTLGNVLCFGVLSRKTFRSVFALLRRCLGHFYVGII